MTAPVSTFRILVCNDDGIYAPGIKLLEEIAHALSEDVWVVAPDSEQSGAGHSLTLTEPLRLRRLSEQRFAIRGTPTDSIMLAVNHIMKDKRPTLVLSGVNRGANMAEDVTYSGTIAAAIEGTLTGIPSIALSQAIKPAPQPTNWEPAKRHAKPLIEKICAQGWPAEVLINLNFPSCEVDQIKGVRVTEQGRRDLGGLRVEQRTDTRGIPYYWFALSRDPGKPGIETDLKSVRDGWISATPLHLDLTHFETRRAMAGGLDETF